MTHEFSCGVIGFSPTRSTVLLVRHRKGGHWSFPKGHINPGEYPQETAERELFEETGLRIEEWIAWPPLEERYQFSRDGQIIDKEVVYFFVQLQEGVLRLPDEEISGSAWVPLAELEQYLLFDNAPALIAKIALRVSDH